MKIVCVFKVNLLVLSTFAFDFPEEKSPSCKSSQDCLSASDCPAVVKNFRERDIQPTICNYQPRSVQVCCDQTRSVHVTESPAVNIGCGLSIKRNVFQLKLQPRQGALPGVVGGDEVEENSYPWMAALGSDPSSGLRWFCGGSYLGGNLVLTAAHCVPSPGSGLSLDLVRLGAHNLALDTEVTADDYRVRSVILHPDYDDSGLIPLNDIAILVLDTPESGVRKKPEVSPICLPAPEARLQTGAEVMVAGWGATSEGGVTADRLQEVRVEVTEAGRCRQVYREALGVELPDTILCAGLEAGGKDACQGDSGGGLLHQAASGAWSQVGVVSAGIGCARRGVPGLYTRLTPYLAWIQRVRREQEHLLRL